MVHSKSYLAELFLYWNGFQTPVHDLLVQYNIFFLTAVSSEENHLKGIFVHVVFLYCALSNLNWPTSGLGLPGHHHDDPA